MSKEKIDSKRFSDNEDSYFNNFILKNLRDLSQVNFWKGVIAEFMGTLLLCLYTIGASCRRPDDPPAALLENTLSATFFIPVILTALAHISGGHVNPAVSIGFLLAKRITVIKFVFFILAQCASSVTAVLLLRFLLPNDMEGTFGLILPGVGVTPLQAVVCEFIITFLLLFGITSFLDEEREGVNIQTPLLVGLIVGTNILFAANISGGCMNPARNFGPAIVSGHMDLQWIYWVGPMTGGALGTLLYTLLLCPSSTSSSTCCASRCHRSDERLTSEAEMEAMVPVVT